MSFYSDAPAELLYAMPGVGNGVTATLTSGQGSGGPLLAGGPTAGAASALPLCELPHNYFSKSGKAIMLEGMGIYALSTGAPTLTFSIYLDTTPGTQLTKLCATGAFTVDTTSRATMAFNFRVLATCGTVGPNGTLQAWGWLNWGMLSGLTTTTTAPQITYTMSSGLTTPVSFNTNITTPVYVEPYATWSATGTSTSLTLTQMFLWGLN